MKEASYLRPHQHDPIGRNSNNYLQLFFVKYMWTLKGITVPMDAMSSKDLMLKNHVGKWLFPRLQPSQYGREFKIIAGTISVGVIVGGLLATVMILHGAVGK